MVKLIKWYASVLTTALTSLSPIIQLQQIQQQKEGITEPPTISIVQIHALSGTGLIPYQTKNALQPHTMPIVESVN